jgi:hypothetical protein
VALTLVAALSLAAGDGPLAGDKAGGTFEYKPLAENQVHIDGISFIPVGDPKKDKLPDPKKVSEALFKGMAKDPETKKLLKKLLACESVELVVFEKKPDVNHKPAPAKGKSAVVFEIYPVESRLGKEAYKGFLFLDLQFFGFEVPPTRNWNEDATAQAALWLAANEYMHRNKQGYHLHRDNLLPGIDTRFDGIPDAALTPTARGAYIKKSVEDFLSKYQK